MMSSPLEMEYQRLRCPSSVLYTDVDDQCDKLVTDDRHRFITLTVHLS